MGISTDHLGNHFSSQTKMCEYYGIEKSTFYKRIKKGMSLEAALTTPLKVDICEDHLGNKFPSVVEMCRFYNVDRSTFLYRRERGYSVKDALTLPITEGIAIGCEDHLGNVYISETAMCSHYGINRNTYRRRISAGWSVKDSLTKEAKPSKNPCEDHLGNKFESRSSMCRYWHITLDTFAGREKNGWSLKECLTIPVQEPICCEDHEGNIFESELSMCCFWNVDRATYKQRIDRLGWSLEEALTGTHEKDKNVEDGYGNVFASEREMCEYYGVTISAFAHRKAKGMAVEEALVYELPKCKDHNGDEYANIQDMCRRWKIKRNTYEYRISMGWTMEEALTIPTRYSLGEARVKKYLDELGVCYIHDMSIKSIFTTLNLNAYYDEFVDCYRKELKGARIKISKGKIEKMRFDFTIIKDNTIFAFIEFDGEQHFMFVNLFFKTMNVFFQRNDVDYVKSSYAEFMGIPLLRIRYDQVEIEKIKVMIDDLLLNPKKYTTSHNTFLSNSDYWKPFTDYCCSMGYSIAALA